MDTNGNLFIWTNHNYQNKTKQLTMSNKIDEFVSKLKHPLKKEMQSVIQIIRESSNKLEEDIKWGGPSFDYKEPMATFNPRLTEYVALIFHKGELLRSEEHTSELQAH